MGGWLHRFFARDQIFLVSRDVNEEEEKPCPTQRNIFQLENSTRVITIVQGSIWACSFPLPALEIPWTQGHPQEGKQPISCQTAEEKWLSSSSRRKLPVAKSGTAWVPTSIDAAMCMPRLCAGTHGCSGSVSEIATSLMVTDGDIFIIPPHHPHLTFFSSGMFPEPCEG